MYTFKSLHLTLKFTVISLHCFRIGVKAPASLITKSSLAHSLIDICSGAVNNIVSWLGKCTIYFIIIYVKFYWITHTKLLDLNLS